MSFDQLTYGELLAIEFIDSADESDPSKSRYFKNRLVLVRKELQKRREMGSLDFWKQAASRSGARDPGPFADYLKLVTRLPLAQQIKLVGKNNHASFRAMVAKLCKIFTNSFNRKAAR